MKRLILIGLILSFIMVSCGKENDNQKNLFGIFTETSPQSGRSQMKFINGNKVVIIKSENSTEDTFNYVILDNIIKLTPTWDNSSSDELEFEWISASKFRIENLYPDIPENPTTYMTFEK